MGGRQQEEQGGKFKLGKEECENAAGQKHLLVIWRDLSPVRLSGGEFHAL